MTCDTTIHIIDDDQEMLESLSVLLTVEGYWFAHIIPLDISRRDQTSRLWLRGDGYEHAGMSGLDLLIVMKEQNITIPTIVITAVCDVRLSVNAMKQGAFYFFEKPFDAEALLTSIRSASMQAPTCH